MTRRVLPWITAAILTFPVAVASAGAPAEKSVADAVSKALNQPALGLMVESVHTSEIPGLYEVQFTGGPLVYATANGDHFIVGDMYAVGPDGFVNLGEQRRDGQRAELLSALDEKDMIVFPAKGETRSHITVFTDVTCFYCQKLHREVPELNKRGVEVRYLAYPRAGVDSEGYKQLVSAWCADNPPETLTKLKARESVPAVTCDDNPVADQYRLGQQMGVRGTPAMVTAEGKMIPGYQSADELMTTLGLD
jgi:thiol:disulfide interchange protein DsbC